jgi:hypothetical protein
VIPRLLVRAALAATVTLVAGCGDNNVVSIPTAPTINTVTETFNGTLQRNGGVTHTFVTSSFGSVQVILLSLTWDSDQTAAIGMSLGTWNGTSCAAVISQDRALANASIIGTANGAGTYCVRAFDSNASLDRPVDYTLQVTHP